MYNFIEVNVGTDSCSYVNALLIKKVVPSVGSAGCVIHFDQGTLNVCESYEEIKKKLNERIVFTSNEPDVVNKKAKGVEKE